MNILYTSFQRFEFKNRTKRINTTTAYSKDEVTKFSSINRSNRSNRSRNLVIDW